MKKINSTYIDNLVSKIINETLEGRANSLVSKINELGGMDDDHRKSDKPNLSKMTDKEIENLLKKPVKDDDMGDEDDMSDILDYEDHVLNKSLEDDDYDEFEDEELWDQLDEESEVCECGGGMYEGECMECGKSYMDEDIYDVSKKFPKKQSFDYLQEEDDFYSDDSETNDENKEFCKYQKQKIESGDLTPEEKEDFIIRFEEKCSISENKRSMNERLRGNQKKIDKNKNNKIDAEDFRMLRKGVEMEEENYGSFGNMKRKDFKGDTYYDENDRLAKDSDIYDIGGDSDFDTEEFDSFQKLYDKYGDKQRWFNKRDGETMFNKYKEVTGRPFKVKTRKTEMGEDDEDIEIKDPKAFVEKLFTNEESDIDDDVEEYPRHRPRGSRKIKDHRISDDHASHMEEMIEGMFSESKVDNILKKYFKIDERERVLTEQKKKKQLTESEKNKKTAQRIKSLSESISQEISSTKIITKYPKAKLLGKNKNNNLVFEYNNKTLRVTPKGSIL